MQNICITLILYLLFVWYLWLIFYFYYFYFLYLANSRRSSRSLRTTILNSLCVHRRHLRLDNLRTLILADNKITRIQLATDDDGYSSQDSEDVDSEWVSKTDNFF